MFSKVIIGYDRSDQAEDALVLGRKLAETTGAELVLVEVMPYEPLLSELTVGPPDTLAVEHRATRERLERLGRSLDVPAEAVESASPARGLHEATERLGADLIVVGSSHRGPLGRVLAGSVGRSLLNGAPCAVAVAPAGYRDEGEAAIGKVGVGFDASPAAEIALAAAAGLAERAGATLRVVTAVPPLEYGFGGAWIVADADLSAVRHEHFQAQIDDRLGGVPGGLEAEGQVIDGSPVTVLLDEAGKMDLLFVGSRGYGRLRGVLLGSVSAELIRSLPCPVVAVPRQSL